MAGVSAVIAVVWLGVLPRLDGLPVVRRRIQLLEQRRIDPAACFYTELEGISEIEEKMAAARAARPDAFWPWRAPQR